MGHLPHVTMTVGEAGVADMDNWLVTNWYRWVSSYIDNRNLTESSCRGNPDSACRGRNLSIKISFGNAPWHYESYSSGRNCAFESNLI